jgi:mono/diheme cytochrome c family protein
MKFLKSALVFAFSALFIFACSQASNTSNNAIVANANTRANSNNAAPITPTVNPTPGDELASGKAVYMEKCVKCHKENGAGGEIEVMGKKRKAANLTSDGIKKDPDSELIDAITNGIVDEGMPAFANSLSEAQIKAVVKFIRQDLQAKK